MKKIFAASVIMGILSVLLSLCARKVTGFAQTYSVTVYPVLKGIFARISGIFPFSYSPNDHLLTAKIHNHLRKDLRTHREFVNYRELVRAVHVVLGLRKGSAEGNTVL